MSDKLFKSFLANTKNNQKRDEEMSLKDYLTLCKTDTLAFASPAERLLSAIGEPELVDTSKDPKLGRVFQNRTIKVYPAFKEFFGMEEILETIGENYEFTRTDAPYDSTAVRYEIPDRGCFGIIANESEPFCSSCTRLRLSSNGYLYGCLSNAACHDIKPILELDHHQAMARLQTMLVKTLADKQELSFRGEVTVMKFIGG